MIGAAHQRTMRSIAPIALVAQGKQAGAAGDGPGSEVVLDRSHLAGEVRGGNHIHTRKRQQQDVGGLNEDARDLTLQSLDLLGFSLPIVVEGQGNAPLKKRGRIGGGRLTRPGQHGCQGRLLEAYLLSSQGVGETCQPGLLHGLSRFEGAHQGEHHVTVPGGGETSDVARIGRVQILTDLAAEQGGLSHPVAALTDEQLQLAEERTDGRLGQSTATDSSAMDGGQVGVVGLDARIGGGAILLGGEGMDEADLDAAGGEEALGNVVITTGAFDGHDEVAQLVLLPGGLKLGQGEVEFGTIEFDGVRWDEDATREVAQHPLEASPGTVDADDAEVFGTDALDAWLDDPVGLVNGDDKSPPPTSSRPLSCHENHLREKGEHKSPSSSKAAGTPIF